MVTHILYMLSLSLSQHIILHAAVPWPSLPGSTHSGTDDVVQPLRWMGLLHEHRNSKQLPQVQILVYMYWI